MADLTEAERAELRQLRDDRRKADAEFRQTVTTTMTTLRETVIRIEQKVESGSAQTVLLNSEIQSLRSELPAMQQQVGALVTECAAVSESADRLEKRVGSLERGRRTMKKILATVAALIAAAIPTWLKLKKGE